MSDLLNRKDEINLIVVDCRYEYEYQGIQLKFPNKFLGGHIRGAINITNPGLLEKLFFTNKNLVQDRNYVQCLRNDFQGTLSRLDIDPSTYQAESPCTPIIVFHCEFSQKRGPRALKVFRTLDREFNKWPLLNYPEIYILEGGYERFHAEQPVRLLSGKISNLDSLHS
jgi:hypothetical protein